MKRDKIKDQQFRDQIDAIVHDQNLSDTQKQLLRETAARLKAEGKTNAEISELTGIRISRIRELTSGCCGETTSR